MCGPNLSSILYQPDFVNLLDFKSFKTLREVSKALRGEVDGIFARVVIDRFQSGDLDLYRFKLSVMADFPEEQRKRLKSLDVATHNLKLVASSFSNIKRLNIHAAASISNRLINQLSAFQLETLDLTDCDIKLPKKPLSAKIDSLTHLIVKYEHMLKPGWLTRCFPNIKLLTLNTPHPLEVRHIKIIKNFKNLETLDYGDHIFDFYPSIYIDCPFLTLVKFQTRPSRNSPTLVFSYEEKMKNGQFCGDSKIVGANGYTYQGSTKQGERHGLGTGTFVGGATFAGTFDKGQQVDGTITYTNGNQFNGRFEKSNPKEGTLFYRNGDTVHGTFSHSNQCFYCHGTFTSADKQIQTGIFKILDRGPPTLLNT